MGRYTQEFKTEAIALASKSHRTHQEIALDLGINPSTFRNWMSEAMMTGKSKGNKPDKKSQAELGKGAFPGGTKIPPTKVEIVRPK